MSGKEIIEKNTLSHISMVFSCLSLIILAIPFGFIAFCFAIGALSDQERKGSIALIMSIVLPTFSFIFAVAIMLMML